MEYEDMIRYNQDREGKNDGTNRNRQVAKIAVFITSIFVICISVAYAFINQTLFGTKRQVIMVGNLELELKEDNAITITNAMPMYDEVGMMQKEFIFTLTNKSAQSTNYTLRLKDVTGENVQKLDTTVVRYGLTKDNVVTKDFLSNLKDNVLENGQIKGNQTINYSLRLWIDSNVEDKDLIKGKSLSYQIEVEAVQDIPKDPNSAEVKLFASDNLGENCKAYDDGTDTFLVGQCQNNYVWYSGKLWRVVLKNNETGAVKMVTDNAITAIPYNIYGTAFEDSYVDQWLTQEFLPTLHDYENYLVTSSIWDNTRDDSNIPTRSAGTTLVQSAVGLLNTYEYYTTYNKSDGLATSETGYLNNNTTWLLITPYNVWTVWVVSNNSKPSSSGPTYSFAVRPSVNLKSDIHITSGKGLQSEPYRLEGDSQETINGTTPLLTRYSGEYIIFNNERYRIVGTELIGTEMLTKITAVDKPDALLSNQFDSKTSDFASSSIKTDLETYYQNNIVEPYKSMVKTNQTWYLGAVESAINYKASICKTVNREVSASTCERTDVSTTASIGLPRVGEMFTSQITRGRKDSFWTLTPYGSSTVRGVSSNGTLFDSYGSSNSSGARPSMYLKSNVVIASTNTGDGTYEHPYDIELSQ